MINGGKGMIMDHILGHTQFGSKEIDFNFSHVYEKYRVFYHQIT